MARSKRTTRAQNKIGANASSDLIPVEPELDVNQPALEFREQMVAVARSRLFNAELEAAIDIIARERVYRAMLAGLRRRLLEVTPLLTDQRDDDPRNAPPYLADQPAGDVPRLPGE